MTYGWPTKEFNTVSLALTTNPTVDPQNLKNHERLQTHHSALQFRKTRPPRNLCNLTCLPPQAHALHFPSPSPSQPAAPSEWMWAKPPKAPAPMTSLNPSKCRRERQRQAESSGACLRVRSSESRVVKKAENRDGRGGCVLLEQVSRDQPRRKYRGGRRPMCV